MNSKRDKICIISVYNDVDLICSKNYNKLFELPPFFVFYQITLLYIRKQTIDDGSYNNDL